MATSPGLVAVMLALGLGLRHAVEPDHLAAVSNLVASDVEPGRRPFRAARRSILWGLWWGAGHTLALLAVGVALFALRAVLPGRVDDIFELTVAATLLVLGARSLRRAAALGRSGPTHAHRHGGAEHAHAGPSDHVHVAGFTLARAPLVVGMLHGLAGSGALAATAMAAMPSLGSSVGWILLFGAGATFGMALAAGLGGGALAALARGRVAQRGLIAAAGLLSLALGVEKGWPLLVRLLS
jgi:hypothetical protein